MYANPSARFNGNPSITYFGDPRPDHAIRLATSSANVTEDIERMRIQKETEEIDRKRASLRQTGLSASADATPEEFVEDDTPDPKREESKRRADWFREFRKRPFGEFVADACAFNRKNAKHGDYTEGWHSELFWFVYLVRGHDDMKPYLTKAKDAFQEVNKYVLKWKAAAKQKNEEPYYGNSPDHWKEWFNVSRACARAEFIDMWTKIRFMPGHDPLTQAFDGARRMRLLVSPAIRDKRPVADPPKNGELWDESDYEFFVSLAGHLQVAMGNQDIKLPVERVGEIMEVTKMTVSRYRSMAVQDGYLKIAKIHKYRPKGRGDATSFRFDVSRFTALEEKAQHGTIENFQCIKESEK